MAYRRRGRFRSGSFRGRRRRIRTKRRYRRYSFGGIRL